MTLDQDKHYRADEELAHSISHGIGVIIGIAVLVVLVVYSSLRQDLWAVVSCAVFGTTFILLYL